MFTATRLVAAIAIVSLGAGTLLFAAGQGPSPAPAASPSPTAAPVWVTGTVEYAPSCVGPERATDAGVVRERGYICEPQRWASDDPRLGGSATLIWNADVYRSGAGTHSVISALYDIYGDAGGWSCRDTGGLHRGSGLYTTPVQGTDKLMCAGYGDNEGLSAILVADFSRAPRTFEGLILPGEVPPQPQLPAE